MAWTQGGTISPYRSQAIYAGDGPDLILIGGVVSGTRQTAVTRVNPLTGATTNLTAMFEAVSWVNHQAARVGDWLYFFGRNNGSGTRRFYRYNLDTGASAELAAPRSGSTGGVATVAGLIYEMDDAGVRVYDPGTNTWDDALGTPPGGGDTWASEVTALVSNGGLIAAWTQGFGSKTVWLYDPNDGSFAESPNAPLPGITHFSEDLKMAFVDGVLHVIGWYENGGDGAVGGFTWDLDSVDVWALPPGVEFGFHEGGMVEVEGAGSPSVGLFSTAPTFDSNELWFSGEGPKDVDWEAVATLEASGSLVMHGHVDWSATAELVASGTVTKGPSATLLLVASVEYPFQSVQHAYLTLTIDITGGPGQHAVLPVFVTTGKPVSHAPLALIVDVVEDAEAALLLEPSQPSEDPEVMLATVYGGPATELLEREVAGCDSYAFDWPLNSALTGSATEYGESGDPDPDIDLPIDGEGELSLSWQLHGDIVASREYDSDTLGALNTAVLPELVPTYVGAGDDPDCLYDLTVTLCSDFELETRCAIIGLLPSVLPTRGELCVAACSEAGIALFVTPGPGIPYLDALVGHDYRTRGKTPLAVVQELLLDGGAFMWVSPGAVFVSGTGLPAGGPLGVDRDVVNGEANTERTTYPDDQPVLEDFTRHCATESDPCNGDTFETMRTATLEWVEETVPAAPSFMPTRIAHRVEKVDGRIVLEEATHQGPFRAPVGSGSHWEWGWVQTVRTEYTYLNCCPEALSFTEETVHVRRTLDQAPGFSEAGYLSSEALTWWRAMPETYLHSYKSVQQSWHAEGWLRSRIETTKVHDGWQFQGDVWSEGSLVLATPTYSESGHEQQFVPIGQGLWHVHTQNRDTLLVPFREIDPTAATVDIVGSNRTRATAAFTVVTDAAPPTVSCSEVCGPTGTCMELAEAEFAAAHARWVALRTAQLLNQPEEKRVVTKTYQGRRTSLPGVSPIPLHPGAIHPEGLVARVSWAGQGPRTGTPGETTTVEYWSAVGS